MGRALLLILLALVSLAGCRLMGQGAPGSSPSGLSVSATATPTSPEPQASATSVGDEAPEACGFPAGTALEYAGRSTTAELDVQEAVGDSMSDDPADIYITRDKFAQGDLHGRLVCAVFVNHPGFVEITVHPEDGGRVEPTSPSPEPTAPSGGISRADAIDIAFAHIAGTGEWTQFGAQAGHIGYLRPHVLDDDYYEWARDLRGDHWVWVVPFIQGDRGIDVVIDYLDGSVLGTTESIIN